MLFGLKGIDFHTSFENEMLRNPMQFISEIEPAEPPNQPLRRVPLIPADAVPIIRWKAMMEIMIPLSIRQKRQPPGVLGGIRLGIRLAPPHMCQRIDKECGMMHKNRTNQPPP